MQSCLNRLLTEYLLIRSPKIDKVWSCSPSKSSHMVFYFVLHTVNIQEHLGALKLKKHNNFCKRALPLFIKRQVSLKSKGNWALRGHLSFDFKANAILAEVNLLSEASLSFNPKEYRLKICPRLR